MEQLLFDLPHIVFINILKNLRTLGGMDDIYYATLVNKLFWEQGVYHVLKKIDKDSKHQVTVKGSFIAKQQQFSKVEL